MKKPRIIFFDIDGTLIDMEKRRITSEMTETLQKLQKNGIRICIATGRAPIAVPEFSGVEFDAFVTFNGSCCYSREETIFSTPLDREDVQKIVRNAAEISRPVSVATKTRIASNGSDADLVQYYAFGNRKVEIAEDFEEQAAGEVYQMMMGCRVEDYPQILKGTKHAKIAAWWDRATDIIPTGSGKGIGIRKILEYYGIDRSEAMAFGDGNNDIEMFEAVGHGVAMGNASADLKAIAEAVCKSAAEDGIYHYCREKGLI